MFYSLYVELNSSIFELFNIMVRRRQRSSRRQRGGNISLVKTAVLPIAVNYQFTASGTHDVSPATASSSDVIFRASSVDVFVASDDPQAFQIVLYNEGRQVMATETMVVGVTPKRFRLRAPKYLDYTNAANVYWRFVLTGAGRIGGSATFTAKETLST